MVHGQGINHILNYAHGGGGIDFGEIAAKKPHMVMGTVKSDSIGDFLLQGDMMGGPWGHDALLHLIARPQGQLIFIKYKMSNKQYALVR